jgi:DNA-directed RNA polymerase subunit M/transcription elongation factor TFIIS
MAKDDWTLDANFRCPKCKLQGEVWYRIVTSSDEAFEDENLRCRGCGHDWWIDGPDA